MPKADSPAKIDLSTYLENTFGKCEVEHAATELLKFLQERGRGWASFPLDDYFRWRAQEQIFTEICKWPLFGLLGQWYDDGGAGATIPDQKWLLHIGEYIEITPAFIERVSSHMRVGTKGKSVS